MRMEQDELLEVLKMILDSDMLECTGEYLKVNSAQEGCYLQMTERQLELLSRFKNRH